MPKLSSSSSSFSFHFGSLPLWFLSALRTAKMKRKASSSIVKAKLAAVKSKTSSVKARLVIFCMLHNKKVLMAAVSDKIHAHMSQEQKSGAATPYDSHNTVGPCNAATNKAIEEMIGDEEIIEEEEREDDFPSLRYSLNGDEDDEISDDRSVSEQVKNCRREDQGEFSLEYEIDHVAELFIQSFHRRMRLQELQESSMWGEEM